MRWSKVGVMWCVNEETYCVGLARTIYIYGRVVQFEVRSKVWVRELSRALTNLMSAVRGSIRV